MSLKHATIALVLSAFLIGCLAVGLWLTSSHKWALHLMTAQSRGEALFDYLATGTKIPEGMEVKALSAIDASLAEHGKFERISDMPRPAMITFVALGDAAFDFHPDTRVKLAAISPKLKYPLSELHVSDGGSSRNDLGAMAMIMARYCNDAVAVVQVGDSGWYRVDGPGVWSCGAAPRDWRLMAVLIALGALFVLLTLAVHMSSQFSDFADRLRDRQSHDHTQHIPLSGPSELSQIIAAVNGYREVERKHLSERAMIMSAVSHDLGTPATRLRLRAATIEDGALRQKIEADIDQMTGIIEGVLTYTRAELSTEPPRKISVTSLVESIVADYQDIGSPVQLDPARTISLEAGRSIFMSRQSQAVLEGVSPLLIQGRPLALKRAIANLIDNALKYGRSARLRLEADADEVRILVEDQGGAMDADALKALTLPFKRGANAKSSKGFGLGLTIVSSVALEHGGDLTFGPGQSGTIAQLRIPRSPHTV